MKKMTMTLLVLLSLFSASAWCFQTIFVVRHAEKVDESKDPVLSAQGQKRAQGLAKLLIDADVKRIFVTEYQRTQMTASPLSDQLHLALTQYAAKESTTIGHRVKQENGNVLIVGHSNTLLDILKSLGIHDAKPVADDEYDRIVVVTLHSSSEPTYTVLRY